MFMSKPTKHDFQFLLDNFKNRLARWKTIFLNAAKRTTLIRSTLSSLPNHVMYLLQLPRYVIRKMEVYEQNFL